jgi:hypothetical protein
MNDESISGSLKKGEGRSEYNGLRGLGVLRKEIFLDHVLIIGVCSINRGFDPREVQPIRNKFSSAYVPKNRKGAKSPKKARGVK